MFAPKRMMYALCPLLILPACMVGCGRAEPTAVPTAAP
jgi:hypothetical protein